MFLLLYCDISVLGLCSYMTSQKYELLSINIIFRLPHRLGAKQFVIEFSSGP